MATRLTPSSTKAAETSGLFSKHTEKKKNRFQTFLCELITMRLWTHQLPSLNHSTAYNSEVPMSGPACPASRGQHEEDLTGLRPWDGKS